MAPGAKPVITDELNEWLKRAVLEKRPTDFEYDTNLWTCRILAELLKQQFVVAVSEGAVRLHLKSQGLRVAQSR